MSRTKRIWQRKPNPERIRFIHSDSKLYHTDKSRLSCVNRIWKIRHRWFKTLRKRDNMLCRKIGLRCRSYRHINIDDLDEY